MQHSRGCPASGSRRRLEKNEDAPQTPGGQVIGMAFWRIDAVGHISAIGGRGTASNLVGLYALQGIAAKAVTQLEFCRANDVLLTYWRGVENIDDLRTSNEYQSWVTAHFPNEPGPKS